MDSYLTLVRENLAAFKAQPPLTPRGVRFGIRVASPQARAIPAGLCTVIKLDNPLGRSVIVDVGHPGQTRSSARCTITSGTETVITCGVVDGQDEINVFAADGEYLDPAHIATFTVEESDAPMPVADARIGAKR